MIALLAVLLSQDLLRDLGAEDYVLRERATAALLSMEPERAMDVVERAIRSRDREVNARGRALLRAMARWHEVGPYDYLRAYGFEPLVGGDERIEPGGGSLSIRTIVDVDGDGIPDLPPADCPRCVLFDVRDAFGVPLGLCDRHPPASIDTNDFSSIHGARLRALYGGGGTINTFRGIRLRRAAPPGP